MTPLDRLSNGDLAAINAKYDWLTGTKDRVGRVLGSRDKVFHIPDGKVRIADEKIGLAGKSVVEFGCLEGAQTVSLCGLAANVVAIDGRLPNLEKTEARCALYGHSPTLVMMDLEDHAPEPADVYFHSGVLYHLANPVDHLLRICPNTKAMLLDTHHVKAPKAKYQAKDGKEYACGLYPELVGHPKSGLSKTARWLELDDIVAILGQFFGSVEVIRSEQERYGLRATIVAK